jgi:hypothetical protein
VVELLGHASKSQGCISKLEAVEYAIPSLVFKTMEQHVITILDSYVTTFFDLWICRFRHDTFVHVTMGFFETIDTIGVAMVT